MGGATSLVHTGCSWMRGPPHSYIERNYEYVGSAVANSARDWRSILLYEKGIVWSCAVFAIKKPSSECGRTDSQSVIGRLSDRIQFSWR
jgi:hypothetical protein